MASAPLTTLLTVFITELPEPIRVISVPRELRSGIWTSSGIRTTAIPNRFQTSADPSTPTVRITLTTDDQRPTTLATSSSHSPTGLASPTSIAASEPTASSFADSYIIAIALGSIGITLIMFASMFYFYRKGFSPPKQRPAPSLVQDMNGLEKTANGARELEAGRAMTPRTDWSRRDDISSIRSGWDNLPEFKH